MNNRRLLIAAVFHFVNPVEKTVNKQISWCCINFPGELTCQFLTNQSIKIGRRAWPTRDHGKKRSSPPVFLKNWLNFRVRGQFEIKILIVRGLSDINTTYFIWSLNKNILEPAIIWKLVTCQRITSKDTPRQWVDTWVRDTVRWYWSADTLFW